VLLTRTDNFSLPPDEVIFGCTVLGRELRTRWAKLAETNVPVLITGESGTGKEIFAKLIHLNSVSRNGEFVKISCPAIPGTLLECELFGFEKGAFTGAAATKPGRIEAARGGTLFLDEIADVESSIQTKLLQLLEDGRFCRIGGRHETNADVRILCATNRDLEREVAAGNFRADLFYRINVVSLNLPPLRHRKEDIPILADYFLQYYTERFNRSVPPLKSSVQAMCMRYSWPGNIREFENLIKRYVILGSEDLIVDQLQRGLYAVKQPKLVQNSEISLKGLAKQASQEMQRDIIFCALQQNHWSRRETAKALKISYRGLLYKMKNTGLRGLPTASRAQKPADAPQRTTFGAAGAPKIH
jgi:two-component system response regulator AtoC